MKILLVSHSSRPFVDQRVSTNSLEQRFGNRDISRLPPLTEHLPLSEAIDFTGALTLWELVEDGLASRLEFLHSYEPDYKVQSAAFWDDKLLVYGSDRLEVLDREFRVVKTIRHPWIAGGHTVFVDSKGFAWLTSAPANAIFRLNVERGEIVESVPMPSFYGKAYPLNDKLDLHTHFVPTDLQACHVNCAYPTPQGILVTSTIPGSVGAFNSKRAYREIVRGYRGCHGGKIDPHSELLYLTDSTTATVLFLDPENGAIVRRIGVGGAWTHDAHVVGEELLAATAGDVNELRLFHLGSGSTIARHSCARHGNTPMMVNCETAPRSWEAVMRKARSSPPGGASELSHTDNLGAELAPGLLNLLDWSVAEEVGALNGLHVRTRRPVQTDYLATSRILELASGRYEFSASVDCNEGRLSLGVADEGWHAQVHTDPAVGHSRQVFRLEKPARVRIVLAAANADRAQAVDATVRWISLRRVSD